MKKLFFLAMFMFISNNINAQEEDAAAPKALDYLLRDIDQSTVSSGIIYERTVQFANLYNYNSEGYINTANFNFFKQCLLEMYRASNAKKFISLNELDAKIINYSNTDIVTIGIINTEFEVLNYNEEEPYKGGLILDTVAQKFIKIPNSESFYKMHNTVIAALRKAVDSNEITFKFSNDLFFNNGNKTIITLTADFGNDIIKNVIENGVLNEQTLTVQYESSGTKIIKFSILYNDGSKKDTFAEIYFRNTNVSINNYFSCVNANNDPLRQDFNNVEANIDFMGYKADDPRIKSKIDYRIFYSAGNTQKLIQKPIVIIDGFDPGDARKIEDCDCEQNADCAEKHKDEFGNFNPETHRSITDMMIYYEGSTRRELLPILRGLGYDVIIVNFPSYNTINLNNNQSVAINGGAYYIECNAMSIVKLLQSVKQQLATNGSTNQIAIIAPSMAGQISRYALSYMEKKFQETNDNSWLHNVYLWASVDSPHLGANIPLGDQALLNLVKSSNVSAADFYNIQLSSPAAQQQLIEFHREKIEPNPLYPEISSMPFITNYNVAEPSMLNGQTTSQGMTSESGNAIFQEHYNRQFNNGIEDSNGWPQNLRKIALVNGSLSGSKETQAINGNPLPNFANDGEKVLNIRGFQRININLGFGSITWRIHIASLESNFLNSYGNNGRISRFKKLFDDKTTNATNINSRGVMDNVPGGFFDAQQQIAGPTIMTNPVPGSNYISGFNDLSIGNLIFSLSQALGGSDWQLRDFNPIHSFIPTFSALAHKLPNQSWANPLQYNLVCSNETPFDSYFGGEKNTQHTSFTKESVDWLLKELAGIPQPPVYPLSLENIINGSEELCIGQTRTFSLNNGDDLCRLPSGVTWTTSNLIVNSQNPNSITVTGVSDDEATITATFANGIQFTKYLHAGGPSLNNFTCNWSGLDFCSGDIITNVPRNNVDDRITAHFDGISNIDASNDDNWQWETLNSNIEIRHPSIANNCILKILQSGYTGIRVRARNSECGWGRWEYLWFNIATPVINNSIYKIFPNPSNDIVNIELRDTQFTPNSSDIITGEIFDMMGISQGLINVTNNQANFSVSNLNTGLYVVKIYINGIPEMHQLAIP